MPRTLAAVLAMALALLCALPAQAQNANACWNRDLERIDYLANPPEHGDNNFFTTMVAQSGNVTLLYPAKKSLMEFPQRLYRIRADLHTGTAATATGCTNTYLNGLNYFMSQYAVAPAATAALQGKYKSTTTYPDPDTTYAGGGGVNDGFDGSKYYRYTNWMPVKSGNSITTGTPEDATTACNAALSDPANLYDPACTGNSCNSSSNISACVACVQIAG